MTVFQSILEKLRVLSAKPRFCQSRARPVCRRRLFAEPLEERTVPSSLSGFVYNDVSDQAALVSGDPALGGVTVQLQGVTSAHHQVARSVQTDGNGFFHFDALAAGTYRIREIALAGYLDGTATPGSAGGSAAVGQLFNIALANNTNSTGNDFGELARSAGWSQTSRGFQQTPIQQGNTIWFNSVLNATGLGAAPVTVRVVNQTVRFMANGSLVTVNVPDSVITFSPTATAASTTFNAAEKAWVTVLPSSFKGKAFLGGVAFPVTTALPGGIDHLTWQGQFSTDTPGVTLQWRWGAAVYSQFNTDYNSLGVNPLDVRTPHQPLDAAATPEAEKAFLVAGGTGHGGHNYTGSYSPRTLVTPPLTPPASLSGSIIDEALKVGLANVAVTLTGVDDRGQVVTLTTTTDAAGNYSFQGLRPGTYTITESTPAGFVDDHNSSGSAGGNTNLNQFSHIVLNAGINGTNYVFGDLLTGSGGGGAGGS